MDVEARIKRVGTPRPVQTVTPEAAESPFTANGEWVNFQPGTYRSIDFRGKYDPFNCHGAEFEGCRFSKVRMRTGGIGTGRIPSVFRDCEFVRSDLRGSRAYFARFERCLFDRTRIDGWWAFTAEFVDCRFVGPITDVRFAGSTRFSTVDYGRAWNEFHGNDFTDAELTRVEFILGIDLDKNALPTGDQYLRLDRLHERIARARAEVARWPDDAARERVLLALRIYSEGGYASQEALFVRKDDLLPSDPTLRARLIPLLLAPVLTRSAATGRCLSVNQG